LTEPIRVCVKETDLWEVVRLLESARVGTVPYKEDQLAMAHDVIDKMKSEISMALIYLKKHPYREERE
jgi:hypothetical protein